MQVFDLRQTAGSARRAVPAILTALLVLFLATPPAAAQKRNEAYQLRIHRAASPIVIDGRVDEPAWKSAEVASNFWMVLPMDTGRAKVRTDVRMAYDDQQIYLSAVCYHLNYAHTDSVQGAAAPDLMLILAGLPHG